jgi:hypothetical protein
MRKIKLILISVFLPIILNAQSLNHDDNSIEVYSCKAPMDCFESANHYLDQLDKKAGKEFSSKRYASENEANLVAAKMFGPAAFDSNREPNWIVFKDKKYTKGAYGFSYPAVSKSNQRRSNKAAVVFDQFFELKKTSYQARSLGHVHFNEYECFSWLDLESFIGKKGNFTLLSKSGEVWFINQSILQKDYMFTSSSGFKKYFRKRKKEIPRNQRINEWLKKKTSICGRSIGNIYNQNFKYPSK